MKKRAGGAIGGWGVEGGGVNVHYKLASLADSYASLTCFSKSHSDYIVNVSTSPALYCQGNICSFYLLHVPTKV